MKSLPKYSFLCVFSLLVVLVAQDYAIQEKLSEHGINIQTVEQLAPIQIRPARVLCDISKLMGKYAA